MRGGLTDGNRGWDETLKAGNSGIDTSQRDDFDAILASGTFIRNPIILISAGDIFHPLLQLINSSELLSHVRPNDYMSALINSCIIQAGRHSATC